MVDPVRHAAFVRSLPSAESSRLVKTGPYGCEEEAVLRDEPRGARCRVMWGDLLGRLRCA